MGRSLLIIVSGLFVAMGYMGIATSRQGLHMTRNNAEYASSLNARNAAHTAIQIAMNNISQDSTWQDAHYSETTAWRPTIDEADVALYIETISITEDPDSPFKIVTIRIISEATYMDKTAEVVSVYKKSRLHYVPEFNSAVAIATDQFTFSMGGSASIDGNDPNGGQCPDKPGISTLNPADSSMVADAGGDISSSQGTVDSDSSLSYQPIDQLIARLEDMAGVKHLSGNYKGEMGDSTSPGVFFIDDPVTLTGGITDGYGIMVVRTDGEMAYDGELDISGNFTFHGLVIFENALNFTGTGTPAIDGSILIGNTPDHTQDLTIDLNGNLQIQYNCIGEEIAQMAAANLLKRNRYERLTTFETVITP